MDTFFGIAKGIRSTLAMASYNEFDYMLLNTGDKSE